MIANLLADARNLPLADGIVQCVVTSPPYFGLRDYRVDGQIGLERTPEDYVAAIVTVMRDVWRVLKDDGTLWLNLGDSYAHRLRQSGPQHAGSMQNMNKGSIRQGFRPLSAGLKEKDLYGIPWRVAFALQADGWYLRSDIIWAKPNPMPESVTDRPTRSHEYLFLMAKRERYYYDADAISEQAVDGNRVIQIGPKTMSRGQAAGRGIPASGNGLAATYAVGDRRNKRSVWTINGECNGFAHFATFPQSLVEPCIRAGSRAGDLVLDPFSGSGTVGRVCARLNRSFVGCDINPDYFAIAAARQSEVQVELYA
jgi:DNA modification methylase